MLRISNREKATYINKHSIRNQDSFVHNNATNQFYSQSSNLVLRLLTEEKQSVL